MASVKFNVVCKATYTSELALPDSVDPNNEAEVLDYIRNNLEDANVEDITYLSDLEDLTEAVTEGDIVWINAEEDKIVSEENLDCGLTVTDKDIDDIMSCALEGGITYWCDDAYPNGDFKGDSDSEQISRGGELILVVNEPFETDDKGDDIDRYCLDKSALLAGIDRYIAENGKKSVVNEEGKFDTYYVDADVADQIVQYAMFKEVVYG